MWGQLDTLHARGQLLDLVRLTAGLGVFLVAGLGWNVATASWPPHRTRPATL